jgi:uncharacterized caspase-like protein
MRIIADIAWAVMLICLGVSSSCAEEKRVALVIGNGSYSSAPRLPNPRNDAGDVASALKRNGFETIVGLDLDQLGMQDAAIRFARAARDADVALFYYSGHALQFAGANYLMPVDAKLTDESDLRRMTRVDEIVADLQQARTVRILVLDSCRDNPLAEDLKRSIGLTRAASLQRGLARIDAPQGMIVAYATQAGRTAADGTDHNSPYTAAFLRHFEEPEEIGTIFRRISADVYERTLHVQLPELSLSMIGEFYLRGNAPAIAPAVTPPRTPSAVGEAAQAWAAGVKDTTSLAVLDEFVRRYADTIYGTLARERKDELKSKQVAIASPAAQPAKPVSPSASDEQQGRLKNGAVDGGVPVAIGDTYEKVKMAYRTSQQPTPYKDGAELRLKELGIWFFFSGDGKIYTIRLDAPWSGSVRGVRVGDTKEKVKSALGEPRSTANAGDRYNYPGIEINFDSGKVTTIFL